MDKNPSNKNMFTCAIAFYNLENLFDTKNNPLVLDDDFTAKSEKNWTEKKYQKKLKKLGSVISQIGYEETLHPPVLLGVAEVENKGVLEDLIHSKYLKEKGYDIVHYDSPDERGIDTALLYRPDYFEVLESRTYTVMIDNLDQQRDYTRDVLYVKGILQDKIVHVLVNHWPSRRSGAELSSYKRVAAAKRNQEIIQEIRGEDKEARIIIMGDFNDNPKSESVKLHLVDSSLYNPMEKLLTYNEGTLNYRGEWFLFDQIIFSNKFLQQYGNNFRFVEAAIFDKPFLKEYKGRYKGNPFRTYVGKKHLGGFSDHFPVYCIFSIK